MNLNRPTMTRDDFQYEIEPLCTSLEGGGEMRSSGSPNVVMSLWCRLPAAPGEVFFESAPLSEPYERTTRIMHLRIGIEPHTYHSLGQEVAACGRRLWTATQEGCARKHEQATAVVGCVMLHGETLIASRSC